MDWGKKLMKSFKKYKIKYEIIQKYIEIIKSSPSSHFPEVSLKVGIFGVPSIFLCIYFVYVFKSIVYTHTVEV